MQGLGLYLYADGRIFNGLFDNSKKNGLGTHWYHGDFKEDSITGKGIMIYSNGDIYKGNF